MKSPEVWFDAGYDWQEPNQVLTDGPVRVLGDPDPEFERRPVGF